MPTIRNLPPTTALDWHAVPSSTPGDQRHVTPLASHALASALHPPGRAARCLQSLGLPQPARPMAPRQHLSADAFAALARLDRVQRDTAETVPMAPNSVPSLVASYGESAVRYELADGNYAEAGQYSRDSALNTARSGSGVCTHVNGLMYRRMVAEEAALAAARQRARQRGEGTDLPAPLPVTLAVNAMPQVFLIVGDPRENAHALNGDSWNALPAVKSWSNTEYSDLPYVVRGQAVAGSSGIQGITEAELLEAVAQRPARTDIDAHLRAQGRPIIGPALLAEIARSYEAGRAVLCDLELTMRNPSLVYASPDGAEYRPTLDLAAYQRHRHALQDPGFEPMMALRERLGPGDAGGP